MCWCLCWSLQQSCRPEGLHRYANAGVFLWNLRNFYEHLFWTTSVNDCFCRYCGKFLKFEGFTYNESRFYSTWNFTKKRPHRGCFCLNFAKIVSAAFERTFLKEHFLVIASWLRLPEDPFLKAWWYVLCTRFQFKKMTSRWDTPTWAIR